MGIPCLPMRSWNNKKYEIKSKQGNWVLAITDYYYVIYLAGYIIQHTQ